MHCQTDTSIPLKDTGSETVKYNFMDISEQLAKKKAMCRPQDCVKKVHKPISPHENDILLGRGGKNNMHVGNEKLRELARKVAEQYHRSSKKEKSYLSRTLVQKVKGMEPAGRFLRRHPKENHWEDMSEDEDKCREKCAQVLRDAVAFVGLKDSPTAPSMAQREQQLQQNLFSMRRSSMAMHPLQVMPQQQPLHMGANVNPFAMSANTSSQILSHQQQLLAGQNIRLASGRQFPFPNFTASQVTRRSLAPSTGNYEPVARSTAMPQLVSQSHMQMNAGAMLQGDGSFRAPKRRRMSNPFFDPFAGQPLEAASFGVDRRLSIASNSYPLGSDFPHNAPGPRVAAGRRESLFGNLSLTPHGSDHTSVVTVGDYELFPDITENADGGANNDGGDEFATEFY